MTPFSSPSHPRRSRLARSGRAVLAACLFVAGVLAGTFSSVVSAAPEDCLPVVGCVTTTVPSLPGGTLPTLTTTPSGTTGAPSTATPTTTTAATEASPGSPVAEVSPAETPEASLAAKASVRVRGAGARRRVELRISLSKAARVTAMLSRRGKTLVRRRFDAGAGSSVLVVRVGRAPKAGPARLWLTYRSASGEIARASYRLSLPR